MVRGRLTEEEKDIIKNLRNTGKSYNEIAKILNCKKERVQNFCVKNDMGGFKCNSNKNPNNKFKTFLNNFNDRFGNDFEYISGFEGSESMVLLECKKCKHQFPRSAQLARKDKKLRCSNCIKIKSKVLIMKQELQTSLDIMIKEIKKNINKEVNNKINELELEYICQECGETFDSSRKGVKYCSDKCVNRHNTRTKELKRREKILKNGKVDKDITIEKLIKRDLNICYLCHADCDIDDFKINDKGSFVVGRKYPSIDHVVPISKGGTHTWDNVRLSHHYCNTIKSNNT